MNAGTLARPSAWLPIAMSVAALAIALGHVNLFGAAHETDEGAAAHVFQLLMVGQLPLIAFFAIKWLQRIPKQALVVLACQVVSAVVALLPVWYFGL